MTMNCTSILSMNLKCKIQGSEALSKQITLLMKYLSAKIEGGIHRLKFSSRSKKRDRSGLRDLSNHLAIKMHTLQNSIDMILTSPLSPLMIASCKKLNLRTLVYHPISITIRKNSKLIQ